jgi:hypothetical protein
LAFLIPLPADKRSRPSSGRAPWPAVAVLALSALIAASLRSVAATDPPPTLREYEIKAAFLYNFTKFIEWPARTFADANAPIVIGVLGDSACTPALERLVKDRKINGRAIVVRRVESVQEVSASHLLFVGADHEAQFERLEPQIEATPVVTVGESPAFASAKGAIIFVLQGDKVRFEINTGSTDHAGVKISAQLLKLATAVRGG